MQVREEGFYSTWISMDFLKEAPQRKNMEASQSSIFPAEAEASHPPMTLWRSPVRNSPSGARLTPERGTKRLRKNGIRAIIIQ